MLWKIGSSKKKKIEVILEMLFFLRTADFVKETLYFWTAVYQTVSHVP